MGRGVNSMLPEMSEPKRTSIYRCNLSNSRAADYAAAHLDP